MTEPCADLDVRGRIVREATRLFAAKGYGATSVREVVEAAGVTKPMLYYYFKSKEALFLEVVHKHLDDLTTLVEDAVSAPGTVRERLARFLDRYLDGALENVDAVRLLMTVLHPTHDDRPQVDVMTIHLRKVELLGSLVSEGIASGELRADLDPQAAVLAFIGMVNLYVLAQLHGLPADPGRRAQLLGIFLHGVAR